VLRHDGFAKATARHLAATAGCNQGLVFYHFGSVHELLLAALDQVSATRRDRFDTAVRDVRTPSELVQLATSIFSEDLDSGDAALLVEMISGSSGNPGLGAAVKQRIEPWTEFVTASIASAIGGTPLLDAAGADELAYAVVSLYLGLELLSHLDGDRTRALAVFDRARGLAALADLLAVAPAAPATSQPKELP
jgi:AcrR family transcriptional regulator